MPRSWHVMGIYRGSGGEVRALGINSQLITCQL